MMSRCRTRTVLGLSIVLLFTMILCCACMNNSIAGLYVVESGEYQGALYINLYKDGTFQGYGVQGNWQKSGNQVICTVTSAVLMFGGSVEYLQIEGDNLRDSDGNLFIKQ
jgi:hypothetical protein